MAIGSSRILSRRAARRGRGRLSVQTHQAQHRTGLQLEALEPRQLLAQLVGIQTNDGTLLEEGQVLNIAPTQLTFRFDETPPPLDPETIADNIQITRSGLDGVWGNGNDVVIEPGFIGAGDSATEAIVRFAETLPDDVYRIDAYGQTLQFELDLGAKVIAVVPQPIQRVGGQLSQARDQIVVYFNDDDLDPNTARDPRYYQLIFTADTPDNTDDGPAHRPVSVQYDPVADQAVLTFAEPLEELSTGPGTYRLRIGTDEAPPLPPLEEDVAVDPGSSFDSSLDLGSLLQSQVIHSQIEPLEYPLEFPGDNSEPGHSDLPWESENQHISDTLDLDGNRTPTTDELTGVSLVGFVFRDVYGYDPFGVPLRNLISDVQRQRTREVFQLYSQYIGAQFFEANESALPDLVASEVPFFSIVTGDMRAISPTVPTGPGGAIGLAGPVVDPELGLVPTAIMDNAEIWDDAFGASWFQTAMHEIGHLLGLGHTYDLAPGTNMGDYFEPGYSPEPFFPGDNDIVHAQHLHRPEGRDIDMYRFELDASGLFAAETFAERRRDVSFLDTVLTLYGEDDDGNRVLISRNDDYYSDDSYVEMLLAPGTYYVGVSAAGNDEYDPIREDSGLNGRTEGAYDLRLTFRPEVTNSIVDTTGTMLDGDANGVPGGVYNSWLEAQPSQQTVVVDNSASLGGDGTLAAPYRTISRALEAADPGDIVRIVGNGGADQDLDTLEDNLPYEIGFDSLNQPLADGATLEVPRDVTLMIDAGAVFKLRRARIGVGSSSPGVDRSGGALQVLGTPEHSVYFTSLRDESIGQDNDPLPTTPGPGDWGGLVFRRDVDRNEDRFDPEQQAVFLNYVNHADLRYGGGEVVIESIQQIVTPLQMIEARPTLTFNSILDSADAAISADPNSFEETNFHAPQYQPVPFTSDYSRIGPEIHDNRLTDNSINGLFVRIQTPAGEDIKTMTVSGRWNDRDIVHVVSENLVIEGTPGGPLQAASRAPDITGVGVMPQVGGELASGSYSYRFTFVRADGSETAPSAPTFAVPVLGRGIQGTLVLSDLPLTFQDVVARRIYRSASSGLGPYTLISETALAVASLIDDGTVQGGRELNEQALDLEARFDARLAIDPNVVVKLDSATIEVTMGGQLIAEGRGGFEVIFTSLRDDRYGGNSTFDTNNDAGVVEPLPGDWAGIFAGHTSKASLDFAFVGFAGGITKVEGSFTGFNALEIHQATARVTHSTFANNAAGTGGQAPEDRFGRGFNAAGTIFIRGAQPIIVDNVIRDGLGSVINANPGALDGSLVSDPGRTTGPVNRITGFGDNHGPMIRANQIGGNAVNGMVVRGEVVNNESVWDDTDIVHVVYDEIVAPDFHSFGGVRLQSSATGSLVVKLDGESAGLTAAGRPLDNDDRIGGRVQIVGQPGFPVVLTSLRDDSVGAGFDPEGRVQTDTDGNGDRFDPGGSLPTGPEVNNGTLIDNDVAVDVPGFFQADPAPGGALPATGVTVQTQAAVLQNQNFINAFINYVDVGRNGNAIDLGATNITLPPTLVADDVVASEGSFIVGLAPNEQTINWRVETSFLDGIPTAYNQVSFSSDEPLGSLRLINYFDPAILGAGGDILFTRGTPGEEDFRAYILDDAERIGFAHSGVLQEGVGQSNSNFVGWASDIAADLNGAILGPGAAYSVAGNIDQVSLPPVDDPDLGRVYGPEDVATAFAWDLQGGSNVATLTCFVELVARNPSSLAGDWRGILLEEYSHDRNVDVLTEREPVDTQFPGVNGLPSTAQFLGQLAPNEKSGDDNRRLGFEVHGVLNDTRDVDVYSFRADGDTEVWLDLDRTTTSLDTVVELVDANGQVIARSDNSYAEMEGTEDLVGPASSLARSVFNSKDRYSVNLSDAGMRVRLPGALGTTNIYHVRVRSSHPDVNDDLTGGLTQGGYQLQLRLQEMDEVPGSSVQFADIRNAVNGIEIIGQPAHSPLLGEITEVDGDNDTQGNAQVLGNVLSADRGAVSLTGSITTFDDIDWYEFDVRLDGIQRISGGLNAAPVYAGITIDVDFTDGLARPNTAIHIFNEDGNLVYNSLDSSIPDDQPALSGSDALTDLSTGSAGSRDPFLGTVQLQEGTYYMSVTSPSYTYDGIESNPFLRREPINSLVRVAEDRIGSSGGSNIAEGPQIPILFTDSFSLVAPEVSQLRDGETFTITDQLGDSVAYEFDNDNSVRGLNVAIPYDDTPLLGDTPGSLAATISQAITANGPAGVTVGGGGGAILVGGVTLQGAVGVNRKPAPGSSTAALYVSKPSNVPFYLGDVTMFVTVDSGLDQSRLITVDPYMGGEENTVGVFNANVDDLAIRPDGRLYAFSNPEQAPINDANTGNYHWIDPQSLATQNLSTNLGDDGIQTFQEDPQNPGNIAQADDGVRFQGLTFGQIGEPLRGFAIGDRGLPNPPGVLGPTTNLLYEFNVDTGQAFSIEPPTPADREDQDRLQGGGTQIRERGQLDTTTDPIGLGNTALLTVEATEITVSGTTLPRIVDGLQFTVDDGTGTLYAFEFNSGPEVNYTYSPQTGIYVRDGDTFLLDGISYEFDTGSVVVVTALNGNGIVDGDTLTISDDQIPTVTRIFEFDDGTGGPIGAGRVRIPFNSDMDQATLIATIINSINAVGNFNVEASLLPNSNRISLRGESPALGARTTSSGIAIQGTPGSAGNPIPVEENDTFTDFGLAVAQGVPGGSVDGNRINFPGFVVGSFPQLVNRGVFQPVATSDGSVTPGFIGVDFGAADSQQDVGNRAATAININTPLTATVTGNAVVLQGSAFVVSADPPLRVGGSAPGGNFTGLAIIDGVLYGVTGPDLFGQGGGGGGLFRILGPRTNNAVADYVETATDLLTGGRDPFGFPTGGPIEFAALSAGPDNLDDGRFAEMLFGMDVYGNLYAFDLEGHLQPVFMNSQTSVSIGGSFGFFGDITGFAFSTLDMNLWHVTGQRREDDGHGWNEAPDGSRRAEQTPGNSSLYFGFEDPNNQPGNWGGVNDPVIRDNYDFPGGAAATVTSNTFSLRDYDSTDRPTLYFNYFLATEEAEGDIAPPPFMRDSFRVFISDDDGEWQLLATNNSYRGNGTADDEFDYEPFSVQELADNAGWMQARVDLSPYGGGENLRLRFDFSSAGSFDLGSAGFFGLGLASSGGDEVRAIPGERLRDGDTFLLQDLMNFGLATFEFDLGYTFEVPTGAALSDGETFTLTDDVNPPVTFEFDLGDGVANGHVPVRFDRGQSPYELASAIEDAVLLGFGKGIQQRDLTREQNDTISQPVRTGLTSGYIRGQGAIGDNPTLFGPLAGRDVDMVEIHLDVGQLVTVDVDTDPFDFDSLGSSYLRLFDIDGEQVAFNNNGSAPGEPGFTQDSYLEYTATESGSYYVAVSGYGNVAYDPFVQGSGISGSTGNYHLEVHLVGEDSPVETYLNGHRLNLQSVTSVGQSPGAALVVDGAPGTFGEPIPIHSDMSADEIALEIRRGLATWQGSGDPLGIPGYADVVRVIGSEVIDPGPLGLTVTGFFDDEPLFDFDINGLDGDIFGAFNASTLANGNTNNNYPGFLRGRDNAHEGAYIDDIIIGFAERGEMLTGADTNDQFNLEDPLPAEEILVGDYQMEFRLSSFYGLRAPFPIPTLILTEAFDPTERLASAVTLIAPPGSAVADGMTFIVGDGTTDLVMEYDDPSLRNGVDPGNVPVPFTPADSAATVASSIQDVINSPAIQALVDLRAASRESSARIELFGNPVVKTGDELKTRDLTESNDIIPEAIDSQIRPLGAQRFRGTGELGDNPLIGAGLDVDMIHFQLDAGDRVTIDVDSVEVPLDAILRLFDAVGNELVSSDDDPAPGEAASREPYLDYTATVAGDYYAGVSGFSNFNYDPWVIGSGIVGSVGPYEVEIIVGGDKQPVEVLENEWFGDQNVHRDQGQVVVHSTNIQHSAGYGILIDAGSRRTPGDYPRQGSPRLLYEWNEAGLVSGVTVKNNVISYNRAGAIQFSGDPQLANQPEAPVPFGRIVNNTLVGGRPAQLPELLDNTPLGVGIQVDEFASPTLLNNIVTNFEIGINVDATSLSTVIGGTLYQDNRANSTGGLGDFPIVLQTNELLFVDRDKGNFNLAENSRAIDSSIDSLRDRPDMITVSEPLGIPVSPILAPEMDITGQLRVDDPSVDAPAGLGDNVFKDRGAIDRADFLGPSAALVNPLDNDAEGVDKNPAVGTVQINDPRVRSFEIQLSDGLNETQRQGGSGVDPDTVTADAVTVLRNGLPLAEGVDYTFSYDSNARIIRLNPLAGVWAPGRVYRILLDNTESGIRDLANNLMQPNETTGETQFTISIGGEDQDFSDAPFPYPTLLLDGAASHVIETGFRLGNLVDEEPDGIPTLNADGDVPDEDGVTFLDPIVPGLTTRVQVVASQAGRLDAWMDVNRDGDWNDSGDKIFDSIVLQAGVNTLQVAVPQSASHGASYARFRLSREGGLSPGGLALNGEVEDYRVEIVSQTPWQNEVLPLDVNDDGAVVPLDALLVINELNNHQVSDPVSGLLPNPPEPPDVPETVGYFDVDGDNFVSPRDALLIINELNRPSVLAVAVEAEGEADLSAGTILAGAAVEDPSRLAMNVLVGAALEMPGPSGAAVDELPTRAVDELVSATLAPSSPQRLMDAPVPVDLQLLDDPRLDVEEMDQWMEDLATDLLSLPLGTDGLDQTDS